MMPLTKKKIKRVGEPKERRFRYCIDVEKIVLNTNFEKRNWQEVCAFEGNWNLYWANIKTCRFIFGIKNKERMRDNQLINHFPNSMELSRKDYFIKNIKNYRKDLERSKDPVAVRHTRDVDDDIGGTRYIYLNFVPMTFVLPIDYMLFVEQFRKNPDQTWIMKPCGKSQGIGIFLVNRLSQLRKWAYESRNSYSPHFNRNPYVISKYIMNPLLIFGKKFDLRLYVLVTSFEPLRAYLYKEGFCRFCAINYDNSASNLNNVYVHLTNISIQRNNEAYNSMNGCKWSLSNLMLYLESKCGPDVHTRFYDNVNDLLWHTLRSVAPVMSNDLHCFEVYGVDVIIDDNYKLWLIEVNSCPSLEGTTPSDLAMKTRLIDNILNVVIPPTGFPDAHWSKQPDEETLSNFVVITKRPLPPGEHREPSLLIKPTSSEEDWEQNAASSTENSESSNVSNNSNNAKKPSTVTPANKVVKNTINSSLRKAVETRVQPKTLKVANKSPKAGKTEQTETKTQHKSNGLGLASKKPVQMLQVQSKSVEKNKFLTQKPEKISQKTVVLSKTDKLLTQKTVQILEKTSKADKLLTQKTDKILQMTSKTDKLLTQKPDKILQKTTSKTDKLLTLKTDKILQMTSKTDKLLTQKPNIFLQKTTSKTDKLLTQKPNNFLQKTTSKTDKLLTQRPDQILRKTTSKTNKLLTQKPDQTLQKETLLISQKATLKTDKLLMQKTDKTLPKKTLKTDNLLMQKTNKISQKTTLKTDNLLMQKTDKLSQKTTLKTDKLLTQKTYKISEKQTCEMTNKLKNSRFLNGSIK